MQGLEQHAVRVAVDDPGHRRVGGVADRIRALLGLGDAFPGDGNELSADRVVRVIGVDQLGHVGRDRYGVARDHGAQGLGVEVGDQPGGGEIGGAAQDTVHGRVSTTGVQITSSMRLAPQASIASRSKPRAIPAASGMCPSAARKSSSIG